MKKILLLLFISTLSFAQNFQPDSTERIVFKEYQDSLLDEIGKNEAFFKELNTKFGKYFDKKFQYDRFSKISIDELEMELYDQREALRKHLNASSLKTFVKDHLSKEVEFQYWHLLYAYPVVKGNKETKLRRLISVPEVITQSFKKEVFNNPENLKYQAFRNLVPYWVTYENSRIQNFEKYSNMLQSVNDKIEYSIKELDGLIADYSIAQILKSNQHFLSNSLAQNVISQIGSDAIRNDFTGSFLDEVYAENQRLDSEKKAKQEAEAKKNILEFIDLKGKVFDLSKYKGKVIYLDFWASWCGPCKVQFPFSKKLHEAIPAKLKKDIVFLYISIDDTVEKWKDGLKSNGLEEFENGYTEGAWGSPVLQKLGVRSIPRYMLIDKTGKIVDPNAKRPNHPDILSDLLKLAN